MRGWLRGRRVSRWVWMEWNEMDDIFFFGAVRSAYVTLGRAEGVVDA
jgi:hypothetical protein